VAAFLFCFVAAGQAKAQSADGFRWLNPKTDTATWTKIEAAFKTELQPDTAKANGDTAYGYKYVERVGVVDHSALVIIGHKTAKVPQKDDVGQRYSSAFNFDLEAGVISKIDRAEWMWHWKFKKLAQFEPSGLSDIAFTYLSCLECEPSEVLSTLAYDSNTSKWTLREWEIDRMIWWTGSDGMVVDTDILDGADDTISFACLYGVVRLENSEVDDVANRCLQMTEIENGKKVATDVTVVYSLSDGVLKVKPVSDPKEVAQVTAKLCEQKRTSPMCKLPAASTYSSRELTMLESFPHAPKTARDAKCFQSLHGDISMYTVVDKCGRPDTGGGTEMGFFEYRMADGSKVTIHWTDMIHIRDIVQSDKSGNSKALFASK
jgi:hypothetical protein